MKLVHLTKLVNGYQPTSVYVNPAAVLYIEPRFSRSGREDVERGTRVYLAASRGDFGAEHIDVQEAIETVLVRLRGEVPEPIPSVRPFAFDVEAQA